MHALHTREITKILNQGIGKYLKRRAVRMHPTTK